MFGQRHPGAALDLPLLLHGDRTFHLIDGGQPPNPPYANSNFILIKSSGPAAVLSFRLSDTLKI